MYKFTQQDHTKIINDIGTLYILVGFIVMYIGTTFIIAGSKKL